MRKAKGIFMSLLLALSLCMFTACGNDDNNGNAADETPVEERDGAGQGDDLAGDDSGDHTEKGAEDEKTKDEAGDDAGISTTEEPQPSDDEAGGMTEGAEGDKNTGDGNETQTGDGDTVGEDLGDGARAIGDGVGEAAEDVGDAVGDVVEGNP
ncbi:MAG: hypothetical protein Q4D55_09595 [Eubacteriales bacterium]|nr:hypothetical protein [Eubacteriales bacterium]